MCGQDSMYVENVVLATRLGIRAVLVLEQVCEDFTFQTPHLLFLMELFFIS